MAAAVVFFPSIMRTGGAIVNHITGPERDTAVKIFTMRDSHGLDTKIFQDNRNKIFSVEERRSLVRSERGV